MSNLIRITNSTKIPVFIIKYRVAPLQKFPNSLNDVINAYLSIIKNSESKNNLDSKNKNKLKSKIGKIFLIGDSAGGNLICSLTNYLIINKLRKPNKLFLLYPALILSEKFFGLNCLKAFSDTLLNFVYVEKLMKNYISEKFSDENMFLSPLLTNMKIMKKFPECLIICGEKDPIYDHSVYFSYLLLKNGVNVEFFSIKELGHGFMGFYLPTRYGLPEIKNIVNLIIKKLH